MRSALRHQVSGAASPTCTTTQVSVHPHAVTGPVRANVMQMRACDGDGVGLDRPPQGSGEVGGEAFQEEGPPSVKPTDRREPVLEKLKGRSV